MILPVSLAERSYEIVLERRCSQKATEYLDLERNVLVVTDDGVPAVYVQNLAAACRNPIIVCLPHGERSKSLDTFRMLLEKMAESHFTREDCVLAAGGGVVGDIAGFAASCYMRGIDFYNVPTTVLSQVDSSIGGKTAVNAGGIKNIFGSFYQPKKVLIANTMASVCDGLFPAGGETLGAIGAWVAILAYTFQIYFDFSGYSDMAIGLGMMFNIIILHILSDLYNNIIRFLDL